MEVNKESMCHSTKDDQVINGICMPKVPHLVHIDGLQSLVVAEDDGVILVLRLAFTEHHAALALRVDRQTHPTVRQLDIGY